MASKQSDPDAATASERPLPPLPASTSPAMRRTRRAAKVTTAPETAPRHVVCPKCDRPLEYRKTVIGGVKPIERWHYFACDRCGAFVYRDRTRKLRPDIR